MTIAPSLLQAYHDSQYRIELAEQSCVLQIGRLAPALDTVLRQHASEYAIYITAHNPRSVLLPAAINQSRNAALEQILIARRLRYFPGTAYCTEQMAPWPAEHGFLVLQLGPQMASALARACDQHAVLVLRPEQPVTLQLTEHGGSA